MTELAAPARQDADHDRCWTFEVDDVHLQARHRIALPKEVAMALGCMPGSLTRVAVESPAGCRKLMVLWEQEPSARTVVLQLAEPLTKIGAAHGGLVDLVVTGPRQVVFRPNPSSRSPGRGANGRDCGPPEQHAPPPAPPSRPAAWGSPRTPLLPRWYLATHGAEVLPAGFTNVYPRVRRIRDLEHFWDLYDGPLDKGASGALRHFAALLPPPGDLRVLDPGLEPPLLYDLPLRNRTRNCLQRGGDAIADGTVGKLMRLPNFGITSLLDVMCLLEAAALHGIRLERAPTDPDAAEEAPQHASEKQEHPAADAAPHSDAWELIAAAAREFRGAATLGDLLRLDLSDLVTAAETDAVLDGAPLESHDATLAVRAVDSVQACLEGMPETQRLVALERVIAAQARTLEDLASVAGLSRERMRQLDRKARSDLDGAAGPVLGVLALVAAERLGPVTTAPEIDIQVVELLPEFSGPADALAAARRLLRSRLDYRCCDGLCLSRAAAEAAAALKNAASELVDDAGLISTGRLREALDPEWHDHTEAFARWLGWHPFFDQVAPRSTQGARVKAALLKIGAPATKAELAQESELSERQVSGALSNIPSVARADKHRWGLREWIDDVYEGIPAEIVQRIKEDGGSTRLNRVLEELPRLFGVNEGSVWAYLNTPAFRVEYGWVSEADGTGIDVGRLDDAIDGRDDNNDPYWSFSVYARHLDGYSLHGVPPSVAATLGCYFGTKTTAAVRSPHNCQDISVIWRKTSLHGPEIGRLGPALRALGVSEGASVSLTIHSPSEVTFRLTTRPENPRPTQDSPRHDGGPTSCPRLPPTVGGITIADPVAARFKESGEPSHKTREHPGS